MCALADALLLEAQTLADALELLEGVAVDRMDVLVAERIDAGTAAQVGTLRAGAVPGPERRRGGEDRDAAAAGVEIAGHARLGEVAAAARMRDAGGVEVFDRRQHAAFAVVEGVVVGAAQHGDAEPLVLGEQL